MCLQLKQCIPLPFCGWCHEFNFTTRLSNHAEKSINWKCSTMQYISICQLIWQQSEHFKMSSSGRGSAPFHQPTIKTIYKWAQKLKFLTDMNRVRAAPCLSFIWHLRDLDYNALGQYPQVEGEFLTLFFEDLKAADDQAKEEIVAQLQKLDRRTTLQCIDNMIERLIQDLKKETTEEQFIMALEEMNRYLDAWLEERWT